MSLLNQSVTISGLGSVTFDKAVGNLLLWDEHLSRDFDKDQWISWTISEFRGNNCVQISNRLLTPSWLCTNKTPLSIPLDFQDVLQLFLKDGHKYIEDNVVSFYERLPARDGKGTKK